jgi:hypothetical protein
MKWGAVLSVVIKEQPSDKMVFEQRLAGNQEVDQRDTWRKSVIAESKSPEVKIYLHTHIDQQGS